MPSSPSSKSAPQDTRGARRRKDTRTKLMSAALRLMAAKGVDGVTVQEITNEADVGFGSFYNHFPSKEAIYQSLKDEVVEHYAAALDKLGEQISDPAEKIAASARYTLRHGRADPLWGQFVLRTNFHRDSIQSGLGRYLLRDIVAGVASGRFVCHDLPSLFIAVGGTILAGLTAEVEPAPQEGAEPFGDLADLPENMSAILLTTLGLSWLDAKEVATRPLRYLQPTTIYR